MKYVHIARWVAETPWALLPAKLAQITDALAFFAAGGALSEEEIAQIAGAARPTPRVSGSIAVLPLYGVLSHRANLVNEASGGTSTEQFGAMFRQMVADPNIGAIVLDVDSPGGAVSGIDELTAEIYRGREVKPVLAMVSPMAASAAYWIASAASEISVTPSGEVGSIGVYSAHQDMSAAYEQMGIRTTLISAGKYKVEGNPFEPLSDEAREAIQARVNDYYGMFVDAVARGRGVSAREVREGFGEGRMVGAKQAKQLGMADRVETMEEMLDRLMKNMKKRQMMPTSSLAAAERRLRLAGMSVR